MVDHVVPEVFAEYHRHLRQSRDFKHEALQHIHLKTEGDLSTLQLVIAFLGGVEAFFEGIVFLVVFLLIHGSGGIVAISL